MRRSRQRTGSWNRLGLNWHYGGSNDRVNSTNPLVYVDHYVPSKGWRFVIVTKWNKPYESYYPTKKEAVDAAKTYMKGVE